MSWDNLKINLIGELDADSRLEMLATANQTYAWFLHKAFLEEGVDARFVHASKLLKSVLPKIDHALVILSMANVTLLSGGGYLQKLRSSTAGKVACYMNTDKLKGGIDQYFDYCFTPIEPRPHHPEKYVYAGWGVDPSYSYPDQDEKAVFLDSKVLSPQMRQKTEKAYQIYDNVLPKLDMKIYNPVSIYNESKRLPYPDYQTILRKCHYFLCTQFGAGLAHLEAAACGALLVVPTKLYQERAMRLLNHRIWHTEGDLVSVLMKDVDIEANRRLALEHCWGNVVRRMIKSLEE